MGARLLIAVLLLTLAPPDLWAQSGDGRAQQTFAQAQQLATAGRYDEALELYRESSRLAPSNAAPILGIGVCLSELGPRHYDEALEMLDRYLDIGRNPESRGQAQQLIGRLLPQLGYGTLNITVTPSGVQVSVDGDEVPTHRLDRVRVRAGSVNVEVRARGYDRVRRRVTVVAGTEQRVNLSLSGTAPTGTSAVHPGPTSYAQPGTGTTTVTRRPVHQRWWFWTVIGTVVVGSGLAVGLTLGLRGDEQPPGDVEWRLP